MKIRDENTLTEKLPQEDDFKNLGVIIKRNLKNINN